MMSLILAIIVSTLPGPFKKVEIRSSSGDIKITIASRLKIPEDVRLERKDSTLLIFAGDEDVDIAIPETTEVLIVSSSDGDVSISGGKIDFLKVRSSYGDVNVKIDRARELIVKSSSGSIYVKQKKCGKTTIKSSTGDIVYYGPACDSLWIFSNSGDIDLYVSGELPPEAKVRSRYGDVSIYNMKTGRLKTFSPEGVKTRISEVFEYPELVGHMPIYSWQRFPIEYTRVDGFVLSIPFENQEERDFYQGYVGYSFTAKRVDFYLHGMKTAGNFGIYFRGYSERRSRDAIFLSDGENTISSLFLHSSYADFYHGAGLGIFGSLVFKQFWIRAGYERKTIKSLKKITDWALFFKDSRSFPENPPVVEGSPEFLKLEAAFRTEKLFARFDLSRQLNSNYPRFTKGVAILRGSFDVEDFEFYPSILVQYSTDSLVAPFDFYLGGPFSLPGYRWKEYHGSRWMYLGSIFGKFTILNQDFFVRLDVGQTDESSNPAIDIGAGVDMDEWYIGVASPINGEGYRLFGGLSWRFEW